jgi:general secretion pathway protein J
MNSSLPGRLRRRRRAPRHRGFTLLELLIAAGLLAVLALLSWRGLESVLVARERIVLASDELRSLTMAFAQMDEDLRRSWPVRLLRLTTPSIGFSVSGEQAQPMLELLRETTAASEPTQVQRVAYRLRDGVLERGFGQWAPPSSQAGGDAALAVGLIWQPILGNVAALEMHGWISGRGWQPAASLAGQLRGPGGAPVAPPAGGGAQQPGGAQPGGGAAPPAVTGLQVRVVRTDGNQLLRVFPVRD